jgi:ferredoxin--NADP+ reductase
LHHKYHYLPLPTRERDTPKQYLQDLISSGTLETDYGVTLDPATTHVFLCGNPLMIGLPETVDGRSTFPASVGVVELLSERGFVLDQPGAPGNVHFEEYW